ncbi:hypothetical protein [Shinella sp.]|uniref:hypothetical protein n=1 Tax=Shinella sp. TaxID=1870904 RepID=UPI00301D16D0
MKDDGGRAAPTSRSKDLHDDAETQSGKPVQALAGPALRLRARPADRGGRSGMIRTVRTESGWSTSSRSGIASAPDNAVIKI